MRSPRRRRSVLAITPIHNPRPAIRFVVLLLFLLPLLAGFGGPFGLRRRFAGLEAVFPFFAFDVVVVILVLVGVRRFPIPDLLRELLVFLLVVATGPAVVGGVGFVGGENVEGEAGAAAIGRR